MNVSPVTSRGKIYDSIIDTIGATPLVRMSKLSQHYQLESDILAKLEFFNPFSSVKDRIGIALIEDLEKRGEAIPGKTTLIEPTSGNTGIALAFIAAAKGYKLMLTMPESMSVERRKMLKLLGAELVLTPAEKGMKGAIEKAQSLNTEIENSVIPRQFDNDANPTIHYQTTAQEIIQDCGAKIDMAIMGVGTGGTLTGVGSALKQHNPDCKIIAVEPEDSQVLGGGLPGPHKIQGIGAGFVPSILKTGLIDEIISIANETAFRIARESARIEGVACGISSGAALGAAIEIIQRDSLKNKNIVVILPSFAERYLSTSLFEGL
ncbi:MAG: cysteine synthase A [Alphaproteobacteria bacterium]